MSAPRRRPGWWPEGEEWPPQDWRRYRRGRRHGAGPPIFLRFGCAIFFMALLVFVAFSALFWVVGTLVGLVASPAGGSGILVVLLVIAVVAAASAYSGIRR